MLKRLLYRSRPLVVGALLSSLVHGVSGVWVLSIVNRALSGAHDERAGLGALFVAALVTMSLSQVAMFTLFELLSHRLLADLRQEIATETMRIELRRLEELGGDKVRAALSEHSVRVADFLGQMPSIATNAIVVAGCVVYMAWLSPVAVAWTAAVLAVGAAGYYAALRKAMAHFSAAGVLQASLQSHFSTIVDGAKEFRLSRRRRQSFLGQILMPTVAEVRDRRIAGMSIFHVAAAWGRFLIFGLIGLVVFELASSTASPNYVTTGFALVLLFIVNPLQTLLGSLPNAAVARSASAQVEQIVSRLRSVQTTSTPYAELAERKRPASLQLIGATHRYFREGHDQPFVVGPIDLAIHAGEITFIVGGNGSGKTTLAKMIVGLYLPEDGALAADGSVVDERTVDAYRQQFSAVFSDSFLFAHYADVGDRALDPKARDLLKRLQLEGVVSVQDGEFSTRSLSQGQRKRLALLAAVLEDRPCILFDEWAADQDPEFRQIFYTEILPELKSQGRLVIAVTHDDRYFGEADRILKMESGRLTSDIRKAASEPGQSRTATSAQPPTKSIHELFDESKLSSAAAAALAAGLPSQEALRAASALVFPTFDLQPTRLVAAGCNVAASRGVLTRTLEWARTTAHEAWQASAVEEHITEMSHDLAMRDEQCRAVLSVALAGRQIALSPGIAMQLLGREEAVRRVEVALYQIDMAQMVG